jgi:hypothetical protein
MKLYLLVMIVAGVAFYLALSGWTNDAVDRARVRNQIRQHKPASDRYIQSEITLQKASQRLQRIAEINATLDELAIHHTNVTSIDEYNALYAMQQLVNNSCNARIAQMETTLANLVFFANDTIVKETLLLSGTCEFGSDNSRINYHYETLNIGGLDFYFYKFLAPASGVNVTAIQNCIPPILDATSSTYERALFNVELLAFNGTAATMQGIRIGAAKVEFLPAANYTLTLTESFILMIV